MLKCGLFTYLDQYFWKAAAFENCTYFKNSFVKICLFHLPRMGVVGVSVVVAAAAGISKKDSSCKEIMGEI